jgi:hypothetical protein
LQYHLAVAEEVGRLWLVHAATPNRVLTVARKTTRISYCYSIQYFGYGRKCAFRREEPYEVDLIVTGQSDRWAVEIKSGGFTQRDLRGLLAFVERFRGFRPLIIGEELFRHSAERAGIDFIRWQDYLLHGLHQ